MHPGFEFRRRIGFIAAVLLSAFSAAAVPGAPKQNSVPDDRLEFSLKFEEDRKPRVEWKADGRLAEQLAAAGTDEQRNALAAAELQRREADGNRDAAATLGYLYLYGLGVPRDLDAAETRLRQAESGSAWGLHLLAREYSLGNPSNRDDGRAAELTLAAMDAGYDPAISLARWLARRPALQRPILGPGADRAPAERLLLALLARDPADRVALLALADRRLRQREFDAVWDLANRALEAAPDAEPGAAEDGEAAKHRLQARMLRIMAAGRTGRTAELTSTDYGAIVGLIPAPLRAAMTAAGGVALLAFLGLWAWLTRRAGGCGPGIWVSLGWIGFPPLALGVAIFHPASFAFVAGAILLAIALSLAPAARRRYFAGPPGVRGRRLLRSAGLLLGGFAAVILVNIAYDWLYRQVTGRPLEDQFIRAFIRLDTPWRAALAVFTIVLAIPATEEIAFRGYFTDAVCRRRSPLAALLITAAVFGLVHGLTYAIPTGAIGLVAGFLRLRTGSIRLSIAFHMLVNGFALAAIAAGA